MGPHSAESIEMRTLEIRRRLFSLARQYHPTFRESVQDWLMEQMARDAILKSRVLRFIDVLAAVDPDVGDVRVQELFREYFGGPFHRSSAVLRLILLICTQRWVSPGLMAWVSRRTMRALGSRFIARPDDGAILDTLSYLERQGRHATFDLLGEEVLSEHEAGLFATRYFKLIDLLAGRRRAGLGGRALQISIKLTTLTDNFNPGDPHGTLARLRGRFEEIVGRCVSNDIGLTVDAEQFEYRDLVWRIFSSVFGPGSPFAAWKGVGITVQSYYRDSAEHLQEVLRFAKERGMPLQVRLAKGAYWDYEVIQARQNHWPVPVFEHKNESDRSFQDMLGTLLGRVPQVAVAVAGHNLADHAYAEALRESLGLGPGAVEHQTLFGTDEGVSRAIGRMGWAARDYVPAGEPVPGMGYLVRRVLENTSPVGFLMSRRLGKNAAALLRHPEEAKPLPTPESYGGFRNHPPKRLFLATERAAFESALDTTSGQWGGEYPVELGSRLVKTEEVKTSLSPSAPDPRNPVGTVCMAGVAEAQQAIVIARQGFARWSETPASERARVLLAAAERLAAERDALAAWIVHEGGRTRPEALADVDEAVDHFAYNAHRLLACERRLEEHYRPRGIVAVISPWNFPAALPAGMMSGALAAGNAVILKSAEQTPVIAARMVAALHSAGVPRDVVLHLAGWGEVVGEYLVSTPDVDMVAFTGSKAVGLSILRKVSSVRPGSGLKRVVVEMGGKNAIIVFADADLDEAVRGILLSAFEHANQKCSACSRAFVHRTIFKRLCERLANAAASLPVGTAYDPSTLVNPLIEPEAAKRVMAYAEKARIEGRVLVDRISTGSANSLEMGPLVVEMGLAGLAKSAVAREEVFGPILVLVPFGDEDEMLAEVNATGYALTAGVFSRSPATIARMVRAVEAGNLYVNRKITGARVGIEPFGGFKLSGTGPKAGSADYLFAFLTRRAQKDENVHLPVEPTEAGSGSIAEQVEPWTVQPLRRKEVLLRYVAFLGNECRADLMRALGGLDGESEMASQVATRLLALASAVVESASEVIGPEPTILIPGQRNVVDWQTPRGRGFVATCDTTPPERLGGMLLGPLLAGNGLIVAPSPTLRRVADILVRCLHRAGVPRNVVVLSSDGGPAAAVLLAADAFQFAVTDMGLEDTLRVYERLGETREDRGQTWVKALISMQDGHQPGEYGFVRQFALPKTIAIRTLRHGADLDLPTELKPLRTDGPPSQHRDR